MTEARPSILNKIVSQRRKRLDAMVASEANFKPEVSDRSLVEALSASSTGLILECKQSSPSRGLLIDNYQPQIIAQEYQPFASAISVLTEPDFFSGSLEDLTKVRQAVEQPVLCKDFMIDRSQLYSARAAGADVILLMLSVVTDDFWLECYEIANKLGLDIITEVSNQAEAERAIALPAKIIGINNRDLHTLKTDIAVTESLVSNIPADRLIISESGISQHHQLKRLAPLVDGFLIGSSLMQSENIARGLRKLIFGEVKICGLTRREDVDLAWQSGASFGGIIFTPQSSRYMTSEQAELLCREQPMPMVGVFMDQVATEVINTAKQHTLKAVQLHGNETLEYIEKLLHDLPAGCEIWKTISCSETDNNYPSVDEALALKEDYLAVGVHRILFDTPKNSAEHHLNFLQCIDDERLILAGGLTVDDQLFDRSSTSKHSLASFDLCSAVESEPRIKDPIKMKQLFNRLKPVTRNSHETI